jgi:hypothetical protein
MSTRPRQSPYRAVAQRAARLATAPFVQPLGNWNTQAARIRALLASNHLSMTQREEAHREAAALLSDVLEQQASLRLATAHLQHQLVDDLLRSYSRLAAQLGETIEQASNMAFD